MEDQVPAGNPALDSLRWKKFPVLDDRLVALVDCMGTDQSVVQAARVSYGSGTKKVSDDRNLIRYLMRHRHTTPFEMVEFKFFLRVPMDTWRQMARPVVRFVGIYFRKNTEPDQAVEH
jgi:thymidylate synthase (FAD)